MPQYDFSTKKENVQKEVKYLAKNFGDFRQNLIDFADLFN